MTRRRLSEGWNRVTEAKGRVLEPNPPRGPVGYDAQYAAVVALLQRDGGWWTAAGAAKRVHVSASRAGDILRAMHDAELVERQRDGHAFIYRVHR